MIKAEILVPLLNTNEPEARIARIHLQDGQFVKKGSLVFTIETTKATSDIESPESGYLRLRVKEGDIMEVGSRLAEITETIDEQIDAQQPDDITETSKISNHLGKLRITKPARALADSLKLDLATLPIGSLVTEKIVLQIAGKTDARHVRIPISDKPGILIYGAGGHAKSVMEIVMQNNLHSIVGIVDDDKDLVGKKVLGIPVLGTRAVLPTLKSQGVKLAANGVGGIIEYTGRMRIFEFLESFGFSFPVMIHPRATVETSAKIGEGVQVFANAYVGADTILESRCMINTNSVVSHDCEIGSFTHIAPGAMLAGHVHVGEQTLVGMGVTTTIGLKIGSQVRIGNGAIILANIPDKMIIKAGQKWIG
jgi:sugar O-acyltransferase (sialic acid O-acetyltransferase NeuD family)